MQSHSKTDTTWFRCLGVGLLLAIQFAILIPGILDLTATYDEHTHLPSGYTYLKTGDFRLNSQHPPFVKLLAATPLLALEPQLNLNDPAWRGPRQDEWAFGARFLYTNDTDRLLFWGRLPVVLLSLLLSGYVFVWARQLFCPAAGWLSLLLSVFSPTLLAHSRFVTFDAPLAVFVTMALYHFWRWQRDGTTLHASLGGLALGLALATKFSGLILLPVLAILLGLCAVQKVQRTGKLLLGAALALALAALVIQACYFFPFSFEPYLDGVTRVNADRDPNFSYFLMGEFSTGGFWNYFLVAFLVKTPLPLLLALLATGALYRRFKRISLRDEAFLWVPVLLFLLVTSWKADNIGVRYLLPIYPLLFIAVGRLAKGWNGGRPSRVALVLLVLWYAGGTLRVQPDQLAFFNEIAGGAEGGHRWLDDSNISWGQDVKRIKWWMDDNGVDRIKFRYGRNVAPGHYGIRSVPVSDAEWLGDPPPGLYAFDTHELIRGRLHEQKNPAFKTDWLERYEPIARIGYSCYVFRFD
ncbi:MAG: phospholipid carrier-dependent glycosyltransferase [Acidobacteriota bacterium]|nr:phospholipid carrier-dependent glycosyltransferase [Acidobacteriota bacterium]